jgi:hypothetical protein
VWVEDRMTPKISKITQRVLGDPEQREKLDRYLASKDSSITFTVDGKDYHLVPVGGQKRIA